MKRRYICKGCITIHGVNLRMGVSSLILMPTLEKLCAILMYARDEFSNVLGIWSKILKVSILWQVIEALMLTIR